MIGSFCDESKHINISKQGKEVYKILMNNTVLNKRLPDKYSRYLKPYSIKYKILFMFCLVSIVPMIIINIVSYINVSKIIESNLADYANENLLQTNKSIQTIIESYEDLLYQLYTNDNIVEHIHKINENKDLVVSRNKLKEILRSLIYVKPYIISITIIDSGQVVLYDKFKINET